MKRRQRLSKATIVVLALVATGGWLVERAIAACSPGSMMSDWKKPLGAGAAFGAASHYLVNGTRVSFAIAGGKLYAFKAEIDMTDNYFWTNTGATGCACPGQNPNLGRCCQPFAGSPVDHVPVPVVLSTANGGLPGPWLFVTSEDGRLYKVNANDGTVATSLDLKRPGCPVDHLKAPATVQLAQFSSAAFNSVFGGDDIVYVPTAYDTTGLGCATTTLNTVVAVNARTMTTAWMSGAVSGAPGFNNPYVQPLDEAVEGCELDDVADRIYCGFRQPGGSQKSLIALQTHNFGAVPAAKFKQFWPAPYTGGINAGDIQIRPFLNNGKVFVATSTGNVKSYNADAGTPIWSKLVNCTTCNITSNSWVEFRNGYTSTLLAVTADGRLHSVTDTTCAGLPCGVESWCRGCSDPPGFNTEPTVDPFVSKIYIGKTDGGLHQLNLTNGEEDGFINLDVSATAIAMGDPSLDTSDDIHINRLSIGDSIGTIARICPPFPLGTAGSLPPPPPPSPPTPPPNSGNSLVPPLPPICSGNINNCGCDQDCFCYGVDRPTADQIGCSCNQQCGNNRFPANRTCNAFLCDTLTHTCYAAHVNDGSGCDDGNTCTLNDKCVDGICHGDPDPRCALNMQCARQGTGAACNFQGVNGQCCQDLMGNFTCVDTQHSSNQCGTCATGLPAPVCNPSGPTPTCINGQCCANCGTPNCIDLSSDRNNCGACGNVCQPATAVCVNGNCEYGYGVQTGTVTFTTVNACDRNTFPNAQHITSWSVGTADDGTLFTDLGPTFNYFGKSYSSVWIGTNGVMGFGPPMGPPEAWWNNACVSPPSFQFSQHGLIAPFWDDLNVPPAAAGPGAEVCINRLAGQVLVTWSHAQFLGDQTSDLNFTVELLPNGNPLGNRIRFIYGNMTATDTNRAHGSQATCGVEDTFGVGSKQFSCNASFLPAVTANFALQFAPQ